MSFYGLSSKLYSSALRKQTYFFRSLKGITLTSLRTTFIHLFTVARTFLLLNAPFTFLPIKLFFIYTEVGNLFNRKRCRYLLVCRFIYLFTF